MTPDLRNEFQSLRDRATQHLRNVPEIENFRHIFSLWKFPSYSPALRCSVYTPAFAAFTIWRSDLDLEKLRTPVERLKYPKDLAPTFEEHTLELPRTDIEDFERRIQSISIPVYLGQSQVVGLDGTTFEFHYGDLLCGALIQWWGNHPTEWQPLTNVLRQILDELDERRKERDKQSGIEDPMTSKE